MLRQCLTDCFTEADGESIDIARVLWVIGCLAYLALSTYATIKNGAFDPLNWGTGYGALLGGGGVGVGFRARGEKQ